MSLLRDRLRGGGGAIAHEDIRTVFHVMETDTVDRNLPRAYLARLNESDTAPNILAVQEVRAVESELPALRKSLASMGWLSFFAPAQVLDSGYCSAGVGLLWRPWVHICAKPTTLIA